MIDISILPDERLVEGLPIIRLKRFRGQTITDGSSRNVPKSAKS